MAQENVGKHSPEGSARLERIIDRFEDAWQRGERPAIEDYLPVGDHLLLLVELVQVDLERRLKGGETVRVETYLQRYPELVADGQSAVLVDLAAAEYELRMRRESGLTPAEYLQRFPQFAKELSSRLKPRLPLTRRYPLRLNCPRCHNPIEISDEAGEEATCPLCGSTIRLDTEVTFSWAEETLPQLGKFELLEEVGRGAFGTVYRVRDTQLGRIVAIKMPSSGSFTCKEDEERFEREARAAASLDHPGIVRVLEVGRSQTFPYIVTEYVWGISLAIALTGRRFPFRETAQIIAQVAEALDHAHQNKVIHRDVKPSNIMLELDKAVSPGATSQDPSSARSNGSSAAPSAVAEIDALPSSESNGLHPSTSHWRARIMDFGLARRDEGEVTLTLDDRPLGTPAYISPEQARGEGHRADGRSDVFSLGVILYELLTGERPFRGDKRMLLHQVLWEESRPPRKLNDQIPRDLETITLKCLAKEPGRRYRSAGEMAADLRHWLAAEPIRARRVKAPERLWLWCRRRPAVASLVAALALALIGGMSGVTWQWSRANQGWAEAEQHRREATRYFKDARMEVDTFLTTTSDVLEFYPGVQPARERLLRQAAEELERFSRETSGDPELQAEFGKVLVRLGDVRGTLGELTEAEATYRKALSRFDELSRLNPETPDFVFNRANSRIKLGIVLEALGGNKEAKDAYNQAINELEDLIRTNPKAGDYRDLLGTCRHNLGLLLFALGRHADAEKCAQRAVMDFEDLVKLNGSQRRYRFGLAKCRESLGLIRDQQGRSEDAVAIFREAIRDLESLGIADPNHPDYVEARADSHINLANAQSVLGHDDEAQNAYKAAVIDYTDLLKVMPDVPRFRESQGWGEINLGQLLHKRGFNHQAQEHLAAAIATFTELVEDHPRYAEYREKVARGRISLALVLRDLGDNITAEKLLENAIESFQMLRDADTDESIPSYRELAAISRSQHAAVLHSFGRHQEAAQEFVCAIEELRALADNDPGTPRYSDDLAWSYTYSGDLLLDMNKPDMAANDYRQVLELRKKLVKDSPVAAERLCNLAWFLANCRIENLRDPEAAVEMAKRAKALAPDSATYSTVLGAAHYRAGNLGESISALEQAGRLRQGGHCLDQFFLTMAYSKTRNEQKAQACFDQGTAWMAENSPRNPELERIRNEAMASLMNSLH